MKTVRKKLADKLTEECNETVEEVKLAKIASAEHQCSSCTLYIVLFSVFFRINVGIGIYFVYSHWCSKKMLLVLRLVPILK